MIEKRDGTQESLDLEKIHKVLTWATEGIKGVSVSEIELRSQLQFFDGMKSKDIHETLTKTAADLISEDTPNYQYVATRLVNFNLRKEVYGQFEPWHLKKLVEKNVACGYYTKELLEWYSPEEWERLNKFIKHDRDYDISYAGMGQFTGKYLVQNRVTKEYYETPQVTYMLVAATLFHSHPVETRLKYVKDYYDALSTFDISIPTPILAGVRTPTKQFSSCFPAGQKVLTSNGLKNIEDIKILDKVLSKSGEYREVLATREKDYSGKIYTMRNAYSVPFDFKSTEDHLVYGLKKKNEFSRKNYSVPSWNEIKNYEVGDFVHIPVNKNISPVEFIEISDYCELPDNYVVDAYKKIRKITSDPQKRSGDYDDKVHGCIDKISITPKLGRFLGYFLAEGYVGSTNSEQPNLISFTFATKERDYINDVASISEDVFGVPANISENKDNSTSVLIYSVPVASLILKLCGTGFDKKRLSSFVMKWSKEVQKNILIGLIRGDGCIYKQGMSLSLTNRDLIYQVSQLMLRCGLYPSLGIIKEKQNFCKGKLHTSQESYTITLGGTSNHSFLMECDKNSKSLKSPTNKIDSSNYWKIVNGEYFAKILEINSYDFSDKVYDLQVNDEQAFTVSGVCVHNCVLIDCGDSLDSINSTSTAIVNYVSKKAGIGLNAGRIRGIGSEIRGGEIKHTGLIPFLKLFQASLKSCSQGGVRGGAATVHFPLWHQEIESLIVLKNNKGVEENRVRHMDYSIQLNGVMYERLLTGGNITLFSPHDVPSLQEAFYSGDNEKFKELYEKYERAWSIPKTSVPAIELFQQLIDERVNTGRIYIQHIDHCNTHSSFDQTKHPIAMSNLCVSGDTNIDILINNDLHLTIMIEDLPLYLTTNESIKVKSFNHNTGTNEFNEILDFAQTGINEEVYSIKCEDTGNELICTGDHMIFTQNRGYVAAKNLKEDDVLKLS